MSNNSVDLITNQSTEKDYTTIIIIIGLVAIIWYLFFTSPCENFDTKNQNSSEMQEREQIQIQRQRQANLMNNMMEAQAASKPSNRPEVNSRQAKLLANSQMLTSGLMNSADMMKSPNNVQQRWIDDSNNVIINDDIPYGSIDRQSDDVGCNLSQNLSEQDNNELKDFKNKFYSTYAHQVECANKNQNILTGCGKKCYPGSRQMKHCDDNDEKCLKEYEMLNNGADITSLNFLAIKNNNKKDCVTCTYDKLKYNRADGVESILNQLYGGNNVFEHDYLLKDAERGSVFDNRANTSMNRAVNNYQETFEDVESELKKSEQISSELQKKDQELTKKKQVSFDNCNKFANFADYIEQNGVMGTSVDKLAEVRTQDSATCGLKSYGKNISDVYDKLVSTPYMDYKKSCNLDNVGGVFEDASPTSDFATVQ